MFFISSQILFRTLTYHPVLNFACSLKKGGKDNRELPHWDDRGGRWFYYQYFTDNSFGTLITGHLIKGNHLIGSRLIEIPL